MAALLSSPSSLQQKQKKNATTALLLLPSSLQQNKIKKVMAALWLSPFWLHKKKTRKQWQFCCRCLLCYNKTKIEGNGNKRKKQEGDDSRRLLHYNNIKT